MRKITKIITIPALVITAGIIGIASFSDVDRPQVSAEGGHRYACRHFIEQSLNDPGSVEWVNYLDWATNDRGEGLTTVRAEYRANNQLGAKVLEVTFCDIIEADGEFRLQQFRQ